MNNFILRIIAIAIAGLSIVSCRHENKALLDNIQVDTLECIQKISLDSIALTYPSMKVQHGICCIADNGGEYYFHLYTFPDFKYIRSFGRKGKAKNELINLLDFDFRDDYVYALGGADKKILEFNIQEDLDNPRTIYYDNDLQIAELCCLDNGNFVVYNTLGKHRFTELSKDGKVLGEYVNIPNKEMPTKEQTLWIGDIEASPNGKCVVSPTMYGEVVDIFNIEAKDNTRFIGRLGEPKYWEEKKKGFTLANPLYYGFTSMCLSENHCYLFFEGKKYNDEANKGEMCMRKYDYQGTPLARYSFRDIIPSYIYVDEDNSHIYCIVPDDDNKIYQYKMK